MKNQTILIIAILIVVGIAMGIYLIINPSQKAANNVAQVPVITSSPTQIQQPVQSGSLQLSMVAEPTLVKMNEETKDFGKMQKSFLKIKYINGLSSKLTGVKIKINVIRPGNFDIEGTRTTTLDKQLSRNPPQGPFVFDVEDVNPKSSKDASVVIIPRKAGTFSFTAEIQNDQNIKTQTKQQTITVE